MARTALTGSRIRERRIDLGLKQSRLAELCGISPSYLNLIEHNRRRIGGKLLMSLAEALEAEPSALAEGADETLLDALGEAAARWGNGREETAKSEEFAGRFPGWAELIARQGDRVSALERMVEVLNDRLTHDPQLAASLHDILSSVTAIRSASGILVEEEAVDPEWQSRFHRNIHEDSGRLADAAQGLVRFLEAGTEREYGYATPQEALEAWLSSRDFHLEELETPSPPEPASIVDAAGPCAEGPARALALHHVARARADAAAMPLDAMARELADGVPDPARLAQRFGVDVVAVFRRLAALPESVTRGPVGLALCDASGALLFRRPLEGFPLPRFGAACPLLPLYQALVRPMTPIQARVEVAARAPARFITYAIAQPARPADFDAPSVFEAAMLVLPELPGTRAEGAASLIGPGCRICPREACPARREPSILSKVA